LIGAGKIRSWKNILFEFSQKENCLANARQFYPISEYKFTLK
jgi:hypothetical protein